jgi:HK97 family phage major capsid protein
MTIDAQVKALNTRRQMAWESGKAILERAHTAGRALTAEERASYARCNAEITALDAKRNALIHSDAARREEAEINDEYRRVTSTGYVDTARSREAETMRGFLRGEVPAINIDLRRASYATELYRSGARGAEFRSGIFGDTGASGGSLTIPSLVTSHIYTVMSAANIMRQTNMTMLTTNDGAPLAVPTGTPGAATQIANQDTVIGGSDPTMATHILRAYDVGQLVAVSNDLVEDTAVDILAWVANTIAIAVGKQEEQWLVTGTGTNQPTGIMSAGATGSAGTVATGGSLIMGPTGKVTEKWVDVVYSVNNVYRANAEWIANDSTVAELRKLRVGSGGTVDAFAWVPSPTQGLTNATPDRFLGYPIHASSNVAAMGSSNLIAAFGDFSRFVAREVGGLRLERSADLYFNKNQLALRGISRLDSNLTDATAVNYLRQSVA